MKNKKLLITLLLLLMAVLLTACAVIEPQTPEDKAQQFLISLLADDAELQQLLLDSLTVIGEGVPAPTEEELAAREEKEAALTELLESRFGGLASPELIANNAVDGSLTQWQTRLACTGAKAAINECSYRNEDSRLVFEAMVHCVNGEEEKDLPLQGEVVFNEEGLIDSFRLYEDAAGDPAGFTGWLRAQDTVSAIMQERIDGMIGSAEESSATSDVFTSYNQVIANILNTKIEHGAAGFEKYDLGLLRDVNDDGIEELFLYYVDQSHAYCNIYSMDRGYVRPVAGQELYILAGGAKYGGVGLTELEGRPYICLWSQAPHSGDAEYIWSRETYKLFNLTDLDPAEISFYFEYPHTYTRSLDDPPVLYHGSVDPEFDIAFRRYAPELTDDLDYHQLTEDEFLAIREELRGSMEPLVGVYPQEDGERQFAGEPLDELQEKMASK